MSLAILSVFVLTMAKAQPVIHLVPHSHCDAGYRETVAGYYEHEVQHILNTVVEALEADRTRRFVWAETVWLQLLARDQPGVFDRVKALVSVGQLELIAGGWVMHDEANPSLFAMLNQMTTGLEFLRANFNGTVPRYAWHIDPFGHASASPVLFANMGYSAFVMNRVPEDRKATMRSSQSLEFLWQGINSSTAVPDVTLLAHVLDTHYATPDVNKTAPVMDQATTLAATFRARAAFYATPHVLVPFGNDFAFQNASADFAAMDALLAIINADPATFGVTVQYSTLNEYFQALAAVPRAQFATQVGGDYFPYIACSENCNDTAPSGAPDAWWSGFFTSKPAQKTLIFATDKVARSAELLAVLAGSSDAADTYAQLRNTSGVVQHHDAIPGTSFSLCTHSITQCDCFDDYNRQMDAAIAVGGALAGKYVGTLACSSAPIVAQPSSALPTLLAALLSNAVLPVVLFNPLGWPVSAHVISLDVGSVLSQQQQISVVTPTGRALPAQLVDYTASSTLLHVHVDEMSALAASPLFLSVVPTTSVLPKAAARKFSSTLSNGVVTLSFDAETGKLVQWQDVFSGQIHLVTLDVLYFHERLPLASTNIFDGGNVYAFVPVNGSSPGESLWPTAGPVSIAQLGAGPVVWEVCVTLKSYAGVCVRLTAGSAAVDVTVRLGPLPANISGSVALSFDSGLSTGDTFTTDANAFHRLARVYQHTRPLQGNLYPVVGSIAATDTRGGLTAAAFVTRPMAGTATGGALLLLLHRRLLDFDQRGNDKTAIVDTVRLVLATTSVVLGNMSTLSLQALYPVEAYPCAGSWALSTWVARCGSESWAPSNFSLPAGVHLVGVRRRPSGSVGVWLQGTASVPVDVPLSGLGLFGGAALSRTTADFSRNFSAAMQARTQWPTAGPRSAAQLLHGADFVPIGFGELVALATDAVD